MYEEKMKHIGGRKNMYDGYYKGFLLVIMMFVLLNAVGSILY